MPKPRPVDRLVLVPVLIGALSSLFGGCRDESDRREVFADNYHGARVTAVAFSPTAEILASAGADDVIHLFDVSGLEKQTDVDRRSTERPGELQESPLFGHGTGFTSLSFGAVHEWLAAGNFRQIAGGYAQVWELGQDLASQELGFGAPEVSSLSFSPDGEFLAAGGGGSFAEGGIWLRALQSGAQAESVLEVQGAVTSVAVSADSSRLAAATDAGVVLWTKSTSQIEIFTSEGFAPAAVAWSDESSNILYAAGVSSPKGFGGITGVVEARDLGTGSVTTYELGRMPLRAIASSPGGELFAAGGQDNIVYVVDARTGALLLDLHNHFGAINSLSFSSSGKLLVSGGDDKYVRVWFVGDLLELPDTDTGTGTGTDTDTRTSTDEHPTDTATDSGTDTVSDSDSDSDTRTSTEEHSTGTGTDTDTGTGTSQDSDSATST